MAVFLLDRTPLGEDTPRTSTHVEEMARVAIDYYNLINSGVFLTPDPTDKVRKVYAAYPGHPGLAGELAAELAEHTGGEPMNEALRMGVHPELHAALYLEHRARVTLLKSAVDYLQAGGPVRSAEAGRIHHGRPPDHGPTPVVLAGSLVAGRSVELLALSVVLAELPLGVGWHPAR